MSNGVFIFLDDEFARPLYADPDPEEVDSDVFRAICERVSDALEGEGNARGSAAVGEVRFSWHAHLDSGLTFVGLAEGVSRKRLDAYLKSVSERYFDEVDDVRSPERAGVEDVVIDVIPPWEDDEDDED